jgi:WD40 repeat protein
MRFLYSFIFSLSLIVVAAAQDYKPLHVLQGHFGAVQNIRFSPDGQVLASGGFDGYVILWDVKTGKVLKSIKGHRATVTEVTFSRDGKYVASSSQDGTAMVWDVKTGANIAAFLNRPFVMINRKIKNGVVDADTILQNGVSFVTFSPDSKYLYFAGDNGYIMKGDIASSKAQSIASTNLSDSQWYSNITGGTITSDDKYLVVTVGHHIKYMDLKTEKITQEIFYADADLNDVINAPFPNSIATWSYEGKVTIWDNKTRRPLKSYVVSEPDNYSAASFNSTGSLLLTSASGTTAKLWDINTGNSVATLGGHSRIVRLSRFSPVEDIIATGSYDGTVRIWKKEDAPLLTVVEKVETTKPKETTTVKVEKTPTVTVVKDNTQKPEETTPNVPKEDNRLKFNNEVVELGKNISLKNIQFEQSSYVLRKTSYEELDNLVSFLVKNPKIEIEIEGHTDNVGDPQKNLTLSERRIATVKFYLVEKGIAETRIKTKPFGGSKPIASNSNEEGRKQNRRVELKFLKL